MGETVSSEEILEEQDEEENKGHELVVDVVNGEEGDLVYLETKDVDEHEKVAIQVTRSSCHMGSYH